jgi:putrescine---pyruvate transaminase
MSAVLAPTNDTRSTKDWQAADAKHFLHPFTDFQALAKKGSRVIMHVANT